MRQVSSPTQPLKESPAFADTAAMLDHRRQPGHEPVGEAGKVLGRQILERPKIDPGLQHGKVGPEVGPAKRKNLAKFHCCCVSYTLAIGGVPTLARW